MILFHINYSEFLVYQQSKHEAYNINISNMQDQLIDKIKKKSKHKHN